MKNIMKKDLKKSKQKPVSENEKMETKSELYCDKIHLGVQIRPILVEEFSDIIKLYAN